MFHGAAVETVKRVIRDFAIVGSIEPESGYGDDGHDGKDDNDSMEELKVQADSSAKMLAELGNVKGQEESLRGIRVYCKIPFSKISSFVERRCRCLLLQQRFSHMG